MHMLVFGFYGYQMNLKKKYFFAWLDLIFWLDWGVGPFDKRPSTISTTLPEKKKKLYVTCDMWHVIGGSEHSIKISDP